MPIPGTAHVRYVEENARAVDVHLDADDLARIDAVFPPDRVAGDRLADWSRIDR